MTKPGTIPTVERQRLMDEGYAAGRASALDENVTGKLANQRVKRLAKTASGCKGGVRCRLFCEAFWKAWRDVRWGK